MKVPSAQQPLHEAPSLSKSALLLSPCLTWAGPQARWYDEVYTGGEDEVSKRDLGTNFHTAIDRFQAGKNWDIHPQMVRQMAHAMTYLTTVLEPRCDTIQSEVAIGVNWVTGEAEIQQGVKDRAYVRKPCWQYGTADLVCVLKSGGLLIADWKTGGNDGAEEQLLSLGVAFNAVMQHGTLTTLCLQVNEDGVWPHEKTWSTEDLASHWDSMRFKWEDVGKRNEPSPGIHCTTLYCPHLAYCSAIQGAVLGLGKADQEGSRLVAANDLVRNHRVTDSPDSNEEAGFTAAILSAANRQIKHTQTKLKEYVKSGGSVVSGGYVWADGGNGWRWRKL